MDQVSLTSVMMRLLCRGQLGPGPPGRFRPGDAAFQYGTPAQLLCSFSWKLLLKASGRSKLTRQPKQIDAQLGKQTGAELSALFVKRCLVPPSGLCRPVWVSRMTKPAEDRVAGELNPAGRQRGPERRWGWHGR